MDSRSTSKMKKKKKKKMIKSFDKLPSELLMNVFTRLSVKNLLKVMCVCKEWNSIVIDQEFTSLHLQFQLRRRNYFLCRQVDHGEMTIRRTVSFTQDDQLNTPEIFQDTVVNRVVSYVNGVLLMHLNINITRDDDDSDIVLWNPSIRKALEIPRFLPGGWDAKMKFGFGFDSVSRTYKVVAVCSVRYFERTKVYNLRNRSWLNPKQRKAPSPSVYFTVFTMPINFDNQIYWLGSIERSRTTRLTHFLCFDLSEEAFTSIKLPDVEFDTEEVYLKRCSAVLDNSLAVLDCYDAPTGLHGSVWKGEKSGSGSSYIWTKQYKLDIENKVARHSARHKIELWFRNLPKGSISDNDLENHDDELKTLSNISWRNIKFLDRYMESLVLLGEQNVM